MGGLGWDGLGGDGDGDGLGGEWSGVEWWCWRVEFLGWASVRVWGDRGWRGAFWVGGGMGWDGEVRGFMGSLVAVGSGMRCGEEWVMYGAVGLSSARVIGP